MDLLTNHMPDQRQISPVMGTGDWWNVLLQGFREREKKSLIHSGLTTGANVLEVALFL